MADEDAPFPHDRAALGTLAAELGHELQGPLNLFRLITDRAAQGHPPDAEDLALLREELARLSHINARLRGLAQLPLSRRRSTAARIVELAMRQESLREARLELEGLDDTASIDGDEALLALALAALLDNALAARTSRAGVRYVVGARTGFCVWDDGAGFTLDGPSALAWGVTTKPGAVGMGLPLALRVARLHGFTLELERAAQQTQVWLWIVPRESAADASKLAP